jgi:hypothetical protein
MVGPEIPQEVVVYFKVEVATSGEVLAPAARHEARYCYQVQGVRAFVSGHTQSLNNEFCGCRGGIPNKSAILV